MNGLPLGLDEGFNIYTAVLNLNPSVFDFAVVAVAQEFEV